jgi:hypothetical protein
MQELLKLWGKKCSNLSMMFPLNKSEGEFFVSFSFWGLKPFCRFADRSAHFILAHRQCLSGHSGAQAIWANQKYHGHHVLPPEMVAFVKEMVPQ